MKSKDGKDVLHIDLFENIKVNFDDKDDKLKKFNMLEKEQKKIDKIRKSIIQELH